MLMTLYIYDTIKLIEKNVKSTNCKSERHKPFVSSKEGECNFSDELA
jgi:hypothetical protein